MLTVHQTGYNFQENRTAVIDRPAGSGDYLLLYFLTEIDMRLENRMQTLPPFSLILFTPQHPQYYHNPRTGFKNDWIHFSLTAADEDILHQLALPLNLPFSCGSNHEIRQAYQDLEMEFRSKEPFYDLEISARLLSLLVKLGRRQRRRSKESFSPNLQSLYEQLRQVRSQILIQYSQPWCLADMAAMARLSRSRFCALYQQFFQTSPMQDLAHERFTLARHLLESTDGSIREIASRVGYRDLCHFSKQYKKYYGLAPGSSRHSLKNS